MWKENKLLTWDCLTLSVSEDSNAIFFVSLFPDCKTNEVKIANSVICSHIVGWKGLTPVFWKLGFKVEIRSTINRSHGK